MNTISKEIESPILLEGLVSAGLTPVVVPLNSSVSKRRIGLATVETVGKSMALRALISFGSPCYRLLKQLYAATKCIELIRQFADARPNGSFFEQLKKIGNRNHGYPNSEVERNHADKRWIGNASAVHQKSVSAPSQRWQHDSHCDRRSHADRIHTDQSAVYPPGRTADEVGKLAAFLTADDDWIARNQGKTIFLLLTAALVLPGVIEWMI